MRSGQQADTRCRRRIPSGATCFPVFVLVAPLCGCWLADAPRIYRFEGTLVDAQSGVPLAGARVLVTAHRQADPQEFVQAVEADSNGRFVLDRVGGSYGETVLLGATVDRKPFPPPTLERAYIQVEHGRMRFNLIEHVGAAEPAEVAGEVRHVRLGVVAVDTGAAGP